MPDVDKAVGEETEGGMLVHWGRGIGEDEDDLRTSLPMSTDDERLWVLSIFEAESDQAGAMLGKEILISDYIARPCMITRPDSGEIVPAIRIMLLGPGQKPVTTCSYGIYLSMKQLAKAKQGAPPWDPPVRVRIEQRATRGGRTFKLVPVIAKPS